MTKFNSFGAFVQVTLDIQGLIHVSEFGTEAKMREVLTVGENYTFKILFFDAKEHRMSLGLASTISSESEEEKKEEAAASQTR